MNDAARRNAARIVVIGAGIGGLTTAAVLARAGLDVTVLEAHVYAGGCAGTFFHQGYRFEAGATLAGGFYPGGPMDVVAKAAGIEHWPARPSNPAMVVHLPEGGTNAVGGIITRWTDDRRHEEHRQAFGTASDAFWRWQERTADALWDLALRLPPWPPQTLSQAAHLVATGAGWLGSDWRRLHPGLAADALRPVAAHLRKAPEALRLFVDGQLLIAAQTTSARANALYGASALDLPRRGVVHLHGGMGAIASTLVAAVRDAGGRVCFRQQVTGVMMNGGRPVTVRTKRKDEYPADVVIANLPPWDLAALFGDDAPRSLQHLPPRPEDGWGAFTVYAGLDGGIVPSGLPLHHQVILAEPMAEGNTAFLSLSPDWDDTRAPAGRRALTISTHTDPKTWWTLAGQDSAAYEARRQAYCDRLLNAAERVLPGLRAASDLVLPGTPLTFQRFTRRQWGWVGGFPQTSLFRAWAPRLGPGLWMVGDSIFPGQSTAAVALGGLRVAHDMAQSLGIHLHTPPQPSRVDTLAYRPGA